MTLQKDLHLMSVTPSIPSQTRIQIQGAARSSPGRKRKRTVVLTRADGSEKYETSWSSAGALQTGRYASMDPSTFVFHLELVRR